MSTETDPNATLTLRSRFNVKLMLKEGEGGMERNLADEGGDEDDPKARWQVGWGWYWWCRVGRLAE